MAPKDDKGKKLSDTKIEMEWLLTKEGRLYDDLSIDMKATEKLMKAITSITVVASFELKDQA